VQILIYLLLCDSVLQEVIYVALYFRRQGEHTSAITARGSDRTIIFAGGVTLSAGAGADTAIIGQKN
jgi:hypothetical protein